VSALHLALRFLSVAFTGLALVAVVATARAAAPTPPAPAAHFNDYANYVPVDRARALDARLAQFERDTSNQLVVAIYPRLPGGAALEDFTVRAAQAWGVGQKQRDNGAVLFVFVADRALRIEVGYGLEGSLTDAVAHAIIENELKPNLRAGRPADALDAAVNAMISATRGEYRGTGRTAVEQKNQPPALQNQNSNRGHLFVGLFWVILIPVIIISQIRRGYVYMNPSSRRPFDDFWDNNSGSGGSWRGGGSSGGGGGFSGGGGSFGGGGASGKW
jgi:uncharacterized protein